MTRSRSFSGFLPFTALLLLLASGQVPAVETVTIGKGEQLDWKGEGTAPVGLIDALHRSPFDPNELLLGNAPGNLVEFQSARTPGSIHLLEIEQGQNIAVDVIERGGSIDAPNVFAAGEGFGFAGGLSRDNLVEILRELLANEENDGGELEAFERKKLTSGIFGIIVVLNLGGRFGVEAIRFYPRNTLTFSPATPFQGDFLRAFELFTNDGINLSRSGNPIWQPLIKEEDNKSPVIEVALDPPLVIQHIRLRSLTSINWEIDEIEIIGRGFLTTARYISDIFDAGQPTAWTNLRWAEEIIGDPKFSSVEIRTRTGTDTSPFVFTRKLRGKSDAEEIPFALNSNTEEMDLAGYESLPQTDDLDRDWEPGSVQDDLVNWNPFSPVYPASAANGPGIPIISPSPRRYFQFQVIFNSNDLEAARLLKSLSFDFLTPPLADSLKAEIFPRQVEVSRVFDFTYAVRAAIRSVGLTGFDTIELPTPSRVKSIDAIELWDGDGQLVSKREFTDLEDATEVDGFQIVSVTDNGFTVRFPRVRENNTKVQIRFKTEVLTYSTNFAALVRLSSEEEAFQAVTPGDATFLGEGDDADFSNITVLSPEVLAGGQLLDRVTLAPNPFTPNGDSINDELSVHYNLLSLSAPRPVVISAYDLSGRRVRVIHEGPESSGRYGDKKWDGRDDQGQLLAPGLYLVRIEVNGDATDAGQARVVSLIY